MVSCLKNNIMEIEVGKLYPNKTFKYLVPALNYYGETLKVKMNLVQKLAFGIYDTLLEGSYLEGQKNKKRDIFSEKEIQPR